MSACLSLLTTPLDLGPSLSLEPVQLGGGPRGSGGRNLGGADGSDGLSDKDHLPGGASQRGRLLSPPHRGRAWGTPRTPGRPLPSPTAFLPSGAPTPCKSSVGFILFLLTQFLLD